MFSGISDEKAWRGRSRGVRTCASSASSCARAAAGVRGGLRAGCGSSRSSAPVADGEACSGASGFGDSSSPSSVLRNSAASGPSRMLARLAPATLEHLLGKLPVGLGSEAVGLVAEHRHALHGSLGEADCLADPRGEHPVAEVLLENLDGLLGVDRARVHQRRQDTLDVNGRIEVLADHRERVLELDQAAHRQVLALHRDDNPVGGGKRVDRQQPEAGRRVDADEVVVLLDRRKRLLQRALAADHGRHRDLGAGEVDRGAGHVDLASADHLADRDAVHEHVVHRFLQRVRVDALGHGEVALRVHVHAQHTVPLLRECRGEVQRRCRLGHAALLVGECDDLGLSFHGGSDARVARESRPVGIRIGEGDSCSRNYDPAMADARRRGVLDRPSGKRVYICAGAGGVGKTTTAAALALGLAARGGKVAGVTIDPAPRLADAPGLEAPAAEPQPVDTSALVAEGLKMRGQLWAMRLDAKRTLDDLIGRLAADGGAREEILSNPIYRELSSAVAGTQELTAVAKLYELRHEGDFDAIVLDTPPARNAVDFLEAPTRLLGFLEGRALKVFLAPGGVAARMFGRSTGLVFAIFARVTGVDMLGDLSRFFRSLAGVTDAFGERTRQVAALLRDPSTAFMLGTSPDPVPAREAALLAARLDAAGMARGGLIVNRVIREGLDGRSAGEVRALLAPALGERLAARAAANLADFDVLARRDRETIASLSRALSEPVPLLVPNLDQDIGDLAGLARVAGYLFG